MSLQPGYMFNKVFGSVVVGQASLPFMYTIPKSQYDDISRIKLKIKNLYETEMMHYNDIWEYTRFNWNGVEYVCFFVTKEIDVGYGDYDIKKFTVKTHNPYQIGRNRGYFSSMTELIYFQGQERAKNMGPSISSVWLDELVTNKIEYVYFLRQLGLMKLVKMRSVGNLDLIGNINANVPYIENSLDSYIENVFQNPMDVDDVGLVKSYDKNDVIKCYCLNGKIIFTLQKNQKNLSVEICSKKVSTSIEKFCTKIFDAMNRLIYYRKRKLKTELSAIGYAISSIADKHDHITNRQQKEMLYVMTSLSNSSKAKLINYLNIKYKKNIDLESLTEPVMNYSKKKEHYEVYDKFMRIDVVAKKDKVSVVNIESFTTDLTKLKKIAGLEKCVKVSKDDVKFKQVLLRQILPAYMESHNDYDFY